MSPRKRGVTHVPHAPLCYLPVGLESWWVGCVLQAKSLVLCWFGG